MLPTVDIINFYGFLETLFFAHTELKTFKNSFACFAYSMVCNKYGLQYVSLAVILKLEKPHCHLRLPLQSNVFQKAIKAVSRFLPLFSVCSQFSTAFMYWNSAFLVPPLKNVTLPLIITLLTLLSPPVMHAFLLSEGFQQP